MEARAGRRGFWASSPQVFVMVFLECQRPDGSARQEAGCRLAMSEASAMSAFASAPSFSQSHSNPSCTRTLLYSAFKRHCYHPGYSLLPTVSLFPPLSPNSQPKVSCPACFFHTRSTFEQRFCVCRRYQQPCCHTLVETRIPAPTLDLPIRALGMGQGDPSPAGTLKLAQQENRAAH